MDVSELTTQIIGILGPVANQIYKNCKVGLTEIVVQKGEKLFDYIRGRIEGDKSADKALEEFKSNPLKKKKIHNFNNELSRLLKTNKELCKELELQYKEIKSDGNKNDQNIFNNNIKKVEKFIQIKTMKGGTINM